jgi:hypothetical protein
MHSFLTNTKVYNSSEDRCWSTENV